MITVNNLVFEYPGVCALDNVNVQVKTGSITALVGPNGAGKTTLLSCIAGLQTPLSGSIFLDGIDVLEQPRKVHAKIGYLADFFGLYKKLTTYQSLLFACRTHGVAASEEAATIKSTAADLQISDRLDQLVGSLSRGLRQRVAIAQTIIHKPKVLLLDEPASGLDPESRHELSKLFIRLQQQGMTLVVSSHILSELEEYCTDMLILRQGRLINTTANVETIEKLVNIKVLLSKEQPEAQHLLANLPAIKTVTCIEGGYILECVSNPELQSELLQTLISNGLAVYSFSVERQKLQDIYIKNIV
ncbi:ABC transporter [Achromatium sp. WMS2]|nr:ABC transporter [Achromatium sp. WMS2]